MLQVTGNKRPLKGFFKKLYWIFLSITILFLVIALWTFISTLRFQYGAEHVSGKIVEIVSHTSSSTTRRASSTSYKPIFEYVYKGETIRFSASFGSGAVEWREGDTVDILVNPSTGEARADYFLEMWFMPVLMSGLSAFFLLFALVIPKVSRLFSSFPASEPLISKSTQSSTTFDGLDLFDNLEDIVENMESKRPTDRPADTDKTNRGKAK